MLPEARQGRAASRTRNWAERCPLQRLIQVLALQPEEPAQLVVGLGERPIGDLDGEKVDTAIVGDGSYGCFSSAAALVSGIYGRSSRMAIRS